LQQIREITKNAIEAIARTGCKGRIEWDFVPISYTDYRGKHQETYKLSCTDTGDGMTGPELAKYIRSLSCSGSTQAMSENYGVGAKIAAATQNPFGLDYTSWKGGEGNHISFYRDPVDGEYGLKEFEVDGDTWNWRPVNQDDEKPGAIHTHGTRVVLMGSTLEHNTTTPPKGMPADRWLVNYLNQRFYRIPEGIDIVVRESMGYAQNERAKGNKQGSRSRTRVIHGQEFYLKDAQLASGVVQLEGARIHWTLLKKQRDLKQDRSRVAEVSGHVASLYQDELHDMIFQNRGGSAKLQEFGITCGMKYVVLYVEPTAPGVTTNTARTTLLIDGAPLLWSEYATQFRDNMPAEITQFMADLAAEDASVDYTQSYKDRIDKNLFDLSTYRRSLKGTHEVNPDHTLGAGGLPGGGASTRSGGKAKSGATSTKGAGGGAGSGGTHSNAGAHNRTSSPGGAKAVPVRTDVLPRTEWVGPEDNAWDPELQDRAATYSLENNLLKVNKTFPVFIDMVEKSLKNHTESAQARKVAEAAVRSWMEQTLVEAVLGVSCTKGVQGWSLEDRRNALSPVALSAAVMPRTLMSQSIRSEINRQLGKGTGK
jgi:hypothetical protein